MSVVDERVVNPSRSWQRKRGVGERKDARKEGKTHASHVEGLKAKNTDSEEFYDVPSLRSGR